MICMIYCIVDPFFTFKPTRYDLRDPAQVSWVGIGSSSTHLPRVKSTDYDLQNLDHFLDRVCMIRVLYCSITGMFSGWDLLDAEL